VGKAIEVFFNVLGERFWVGCKQTFYLKHTTPPCVNELCIIYYQHLSLSIDEVHIGFRVLDGGEGWFLLELRLRFASHFSI